MAMAYVDGDAWTHSGVCYMDGDHERCSMPDCVCDCHPSSLITEQI